MLEDIKKMEGINNTDFDSIIKSFIESAKKDLEMVGIVKDKIVDSDGLIYAAIVTYVKSQIDVDNSEMYRASYELQKDTLRHTSCYIKSES